MHAHEMISTHPHVKGKTNDALIRCIEECFDCVKTILAAERLKRSRQTGLIGFVRSLMKSGN